MQLCRMCDSTTLQTATRMVAFATEILAMRPRNLDCVLRDQWPCTVRPRPHALFAFTNVSLVADNHYPQLIRSSPYPALKFVRMCHFAFTICPAPWFIDIHIGLELPCTRYQAGRRLLPGFMCRCNMIFPVPRVTT